jgi:hypothetical protein
LLACKNLVTDFAGCVAKVSLKVIIAGSSTGERFLTQAANVPPVFFVNLFGLLQASPG